MSSSKYGSVHDEPWTTSAKSKNEELSTKKTRKTKNSSQGKNKKAKKNNDFRTSVSSEDEEELEDFSILEKRLLEMKAKRQRQKQRKQQAQLTRILNQYQGSIQEILKEQRKLENTKRREEATKKLQVFKEIRSEFTDWYGTFNSLHQAYLTDMAKLNRQYTRQCKRLDAAITSHGNEQIGETEEDDKIMETKISKVMGTMKKRLMSMEGMKSNSSKFQSI